MSPRKVLAAVANDAAASTVLAVADAIANLYVATVEAVHVGEADAALSAAARGAGVPLRMVPGRAIEELAGAALSEEVVTVVIGARGEAAGKRPAGSTALALITALEKPVVVVPPDVSPGGRIEGLLVPLDGTSASAAALHETVELAREADAEITVVHVQQRHLTPPFADHLPYEVDAWSTEFIARWCPSAADARIELRVGEPHEHVLDVLNRCSCDLVVLGWSRDLTRGRATVVRRLLAESGVPVLLTPAGGTGALEPGVQPHRRRRTDTPSPAGGDETHI